MTMTTKPSKKRVKEEKSHPKKTKSPTRKRKRNTYDKSTLDEMSDKAESMYKKRKIRRSSPSL